MFSSILGLSQCSGAAILLIFWNTVVLGQDGFTNEEKIGEIASRLEDHIAYSSSNGWKIYPQLMFPCQTSISKLYVIGYIESTDTAITVDVEFMTPSQMDEPSSPQPTTSQCTEQTVTNLSIEPSSDTIIPGFNEVLLSFDEVFIPARTIVRFRHIEGILLYQKQNTLTSGTTCIRNAMESGYIPLIHVDTVLDCDCVGCSDGEFLTEMELNAIIDQENRLIYTSAEISVIPELTFTSPGTISSWTFAGRHVFGSQDTAMPNIQIWRPSGGSRVRRQSTSDVMRYRMVKTTADRSYLMFNNDNNNIFTYHLNHSIMVRVGDIVGVEQPDNSGLLLVFQESNYINYIIEPGTSLFDVSPSHIERRQPLLRPEFQPSLTSTPTTIPSVTPSPSSVAQPTEEDLSNKLLSIMLGVSGSVLVLTLVALVVVISLAVWLKQRRKAFITTTDNVAYTINEPVQLSPSFYDSGSFKHSETLYDYVSNTNAREEDSRFVTVQNEAYAVTADNQPVSEAGGLASENLYDYVSTTTPEEDSRFVTFQNEAYAVTADNQPVSEAGGLATTIETTSTCN